LKAIILNSAILIGSLALCACATKPKLVNPSADFSKIHKISVVPFEGAGGREATDEFVRQLLAGGLEVTDDKHPGDAVLKGAVTSYNPAHTLIVFLGKTSVLEPGGQLLTVTNPVVSPGAAQVTPDVATGTQSAQVASVSAVVEVAARLTDASSGSPIWSGSYSYEALDMPLAIQTVIGNLAQSLGHILPALNRQSS
jgi:TolB-like protein